MSSGSRNHNYSCFFYSLHLDKKMSVVFARWLIGTRQISAASSFQTEFSPANILYTKIIFSAHQRAIPRSEFNLLRFNSKNSKVSIDKLWFPKVEVNRTMKGNKMLVSWLGVRWLDWREDASVYSLPTSPPLNSTSLSCPCSPPPSLSICPLNSRCRNRGASVALQLAAPSQGGL